MKKEETKKEGCSSCDEKNEVAGKITAEQLKKAKDVIAGGSTPSERTSKLEAIESKYKLTDEQRKNLTKTL